MALTFPVAAVFLGASAVFSAAAQGANTVVSSNAVLGVYPNEVISNLDESELATAMGAGGVITFATNGTIVLSNSFTISNDVVLDGSGQSVTISGGGSAQLFNVPAGLSLTLRNLTLANAYFEGPIEQSFYFQYLGPAYGGAIFSQGSLDIENCVFSNNVAQGVGTSPLGESQQEQPGAGGAIFNEGQLSIANTTFVSNSAFGGAGTTVHADIVSGGESANGGAICSTEGSVVLSNVVFRGNSAIGGPPGASYASPYTSVMGGSACGGAISIVGGVVVANGMTVVGNSAEGGAGTEGTGGSSGLPLYDSAGGTGFAGGLYVSAGSVIVSNSIFSKNVAAGGSPASLGAGGAAQGGAIYNAGVVVVENSTVSSNVAQGGSGTWGLPSGNALGGGIANFGAIEVSATDFAANEVNGATNYGYSIYNTGVFTADTNSTVQPASVGAPPFEYQWQLDGMAISGATSFIFNLTNVQFSNSATYSVIISNSTGPLATNDEILISPLTNAPAFVLNPISETTNLANTVEFDAVAVSFPEPSYQWQFDGTNIAGATSSALILTNVLQNQSGTYTVIATNSLGSTTSQPAILTVQGTILLTGLDLSRAGFSITGEGMPGTNFIIEVSTNLTDWQPLQTNPSPFTFADTNALASPLRFYRAVQSN